jgi:hypothetical protein
LFDKVKPERKVTMVTVTIIIMLILWHKSDLKVDKAMEEIK